MLVRSEKAHQLPYDRHGPLPCRAVQFRGFGRLGNALEGGCPYRPSQNRRCRCGRPSPHPGSIRERACPERHFNARRISRTIGDSTPGYGDAKTAREYERKIRNLLQYKTPHIKSMVLKLLDDAKHDHKISTRQLRRLEKIIGLAGETGPEKA